MTATILVETKSGGKAILFKQWLTKGNADRLLSHCQQLHTRFYNFKWYGRPLKQTRLLWACGDKGTFHEFGGESVAINEWDSEFKSVRQQLEQQFDVYTNFCLVNHYRDGHDSIAAHSDGELYAKNKSVFTVSLGATRRMKLVPTTKTSQPNPIRETVTFALEHGDLLWMCGDVQDYCKHGIDEEPSVKDVRYSLTLRSTKLRT